MAEKCLGCISFKTLDDACSSDREYHDNSKSSYPIYRDPSTGKPSILKIIHVGGVEEIFSKPISASEFLSRYPGYCLTSPHIFLRPWDVVSPERRLLPGEKFCLVHSSIVQKLQLELLQNLGGESAGEDHRMKDIKESSPNENETNISLQEAAHDIEYVEIENGEKKIKKAFVPPLKKKTCLAYPHGWSPELESVKEGMSPADYIR